MNSAGRLTTALTAPLLFLAITMAGIASDDPLAIWTVWVPAALLFSALVIQFVQSWTDDGAELSPAGRPPRIFPVVLLIVLALGVRLWVAFSGPLAYLAFRGITDLLTASMLGLALWVTARRHLALSYGVWIASLAVILVSRLSLSGQPILFRPDLLAVIISIPWSIAAFGAVARGDGTARRAGADPPPPSSPEDAIRDGPPPSRGVAAAHVLAILAGGVLAWICLRQQEFAPAATWTDRSKAFAAVELLWTRSVLFGWGRACLLRLVDIVHEPGLGASLNWMGWRGTLAANGFSTILAAALFSLGLARWEIGRVGGEGPHRRGATRLALPAVQTILALIVLGGPNSSLPLLVLAGWVALGMAGVPARGGSPEPFSGSMNSGIVSRGAAVPRLGALERARWKVARDVIGGSAALGLLLLACLGALAPVRAAAIIEAIEPKDLQDPQLGFRLARAEERNRWNPEVHLLRAAWLRERLTRLPDWDEDLFQRICATYLRASDLDPYDPVIVLRLAEVQSLAARPEEALESARRALALNPYSEELLEWIYRYAVSHGRTRVALEMVERRLEIRPESAMWWRRRSRLGQLAGFGHEAATALSVATTGAIRRSAPLRADPALAPFARN